MAAMPAMNLDPAATPWGRAMQKELADIRNTVNRSVQVELNANKMQNSSINALTRQVVDLTAVNAELTAQTAYQASLVTVGAAAADYESGDIVGDGVNRYTDSATSITVMVPTGRVLLTVGCSSVIMRPGDAAGEARITFNVTTPGEGSPWYPSGVRSARLYSLSERKLGVGLCVSRPLSVVAGLQTFTLAFGRWATSSGVSPASFSVDSPYISVQVIDAE